MLAKLQLFWQRTVEIFKFRKNFLIFYDLSKQMLDYSIRWVEHNQWKGATEADPADSERRFRRHEGTPEDFG